jgi:flavodoxin
VKILLAYYSRNGHTEELSKALEKDLRSRGHDIEIEVIRPTNMPNDSWALLARCLRGVPCILFSSFITPIKRYHQPETDIASLQHPDVSRFDRVIVGGPKWMHLSLPVARYLKQVKGLTGKRVAGYSSFCGSPAQKNFEMYAYFFPFNDIVRAAGGEVIAQMGISSVHTDIPLLPTAWFKLICRIRFRRPLSSYAVDSDWGREQVKRFCDLVEKNDTSPGDLLVP